jgi:hypothetical protein
MILKDVMIGPYSHPLSARMLKSDFLSSHLVGCKHQGEKEDEDESAGCA